MNILTLTKHLGNFRMINMGIISTLTKHSTISWCSILFL